MITRDINIKINELSKLDSEKVVKSIINLIRKFSFLDLRRFEEIIICKDVNKEVGALLGDDYKYLTNRYKNSNDVYAKVVTLFKDNKINIVLVLNSSYAQTLIKKSNCTYEYKNALHIFHHELAHVHDYNKKIDIFKDSIFVKEYKGIDEITYPIAEICWSEYIANFISSSSTVKSSFPKTMAQSLVEIINIVPSSINTNLMVFKSNKNRIDIMQEIIAQVHMLLKTASYLLGYLHGLNISLSEISDEALFQIEKSNFKNTWEDLSYELTSIRNIYPAGWEKIKIYENISLCVDNYFKEYGINFTQDEKKQLYVELK